MHWGNNHKERNTQNLIMLINIMTLIIIMMVKIGTNFIVRTQLLPYFHMFQISFLKTW